MRILLINKFYFPNGGADQHVLNLERLLQAHGHDVAVFAMAHSQNLPSRWSRFFVSRTDFDRLRFGWQGLRAAGRMLYSFEARRKLARLVHDFQPDVAHVHNIYHQLSPSILPVLHAHGIPIVMTLHDYALLSENYTLFGHGGICEHGKDGRFFSYVAHRCIRHSVAASALAACAMTLHRAMRLYDRHVDVYLSPSKFLINTLRAWNIRARDVRYLPNFVDLPATTETPPGSSVLFVGRLAPEKGVDVLIRAVAGTDIPLHVAGSGPEEQHLRALARALQATNVQFVGRLSGAALAAAYQCARCVAVPSVWYENFPTVVLEAFAAARPVVASGIGGLTEQVRHGETGMLVPPGNVAVLRAALRQLMQHPGNATRLGKNARVFATQFHPEQFYAKLMTVYAALPRR